MPHPPTEMMRSWVEQDVTALAHSAGDPTTSAISTPEAPRDPGGSDARGYPRVARLLRAQRGHRGRYSVTLRDLSGRLNDISSFGTTITSEVGSVAFFPWQAVLRIVLAP